MKFTIVNESLSMNNLMFCKENNSTISMYYQQNEKSNKIIQEKYDQGGAGPKQVNQRINLHQG